MAAEGDDRIDTAVDLLGSADWWCMSAPPGSGLDDVAETPAGGGSPWMPATVPGTAAGALRAAGTSDPELEQLDGRDWWFLCRFAGPPPSSVVDGDGHGWVLELDGLATLADVWLNGRHLLRSESMFSSWRVPISSVDGDNELCIRFAALTPVLGERRPRPRWRVKDVTSQNLRWIRTTLLGRQPGWAMTPAPVGPWRPLRLRRAAAVEVARRRVRATCPPVDGGSPADTATSGTVSVELAVSGSAVPACGGAPGAELTVAGCRAPLDVVEDGTGWRLSGVVTVDGVDRWWPHTHGSQPMYPVHVVVGGVDVELGEVGFRSVEADRSDDGFRLLVNGEPVFCRGASWYPIDPVGLHATDEAIADSVELTRAAGGNMLRIPGGTVYEDERFFAVCDRVGILVWQDVMLGPVDPPADEAFLATIGTEVTELLDAVAPHPSLALLCGGQQIEEQAAMFGLPRARWASPVIDTALPELVAREAPGLVYVPSSPTGGALPFQIDAGIGHYSNVGFYLFPLSDLRRAAPRFLSECLAFAVPPERATVEEQFGGDFLVRHQADWKRGVHRDAGSWFDLEAVRDHYVGSLFGVDLDELWRTDPDRALDLGRAVVAEVYGAAIAEWRRPDSPCDGMLAIALRDLRSGAGWGLVDSSGRPKAPWYTFSRGCTPVAVLVTDEGLNGLDLHLVNDTAEVVVGTLVLGLHTAAHTVETESCPVEIPARGAVTVRADGLFDGFRDLTYAYRFGSRSYELVTAELVDAGGRVRSSCGYLPGGPARGNDPDLGLQAVVEPTDEGMWLLRVSSRRFAQYVQVDVPGFVADDSWFHLPPGGSHTVRLRPESGPGREPKGRVRALNSDVERAVSP